MAIEIFESKPYFEVTLLNTDGDGMDFINVSTGVAVTEETIHRALAGLIGLDHQEEGWVPGPCTALRITRIEETRTPIPAPEPLAEPTA